MGNFIMFPLSRFIISGNSMYPTLKPGQGVITQNWFFNISKNDLVVAKIKGRLVIKRIKKIVRDKIYLEGDNKKESTDSRKYGSVDKKTIVGKVVFILQ